MKLSYDMLMKDLDKVFDEMVSQDVNVDIVGHIGTRTKPLGRYFANGFGCDYVQLPSANRKGKNSSLARAINSVYPFLPENMLESISHKYKKLYSQGDRFIPHFNLNPILHEINSILLVDDNCLTGETFNLWKNKIRKETETNVITFSITVTGDCEPDFYCIEGWRSFEWRSIGV